MVAPHDLGHLIRTQQLSAVTTFDTLRLTVEARSALESVDEDGQRGAVEPHTNAASVTTGSFVAAARVRKAMRSERGRPSNIGRRLHDLVRTAGFAALAGGRGDPDLDRVEPRRVTRTRRVLLDESLADDLVAAGQRAPAARIDSCRPSARPPFVINSRWLSRCTPSWPQLRPRRGYALARSGPEYVEHRPAAPGTSPDPSNERLDSSCQGDGGRDRRQGRRWDGRCGTAGGVGGEVDRRPAGRRRGD